jgi:heat shock protein HslJ
MRALSPILMGFVLLGGCTTMTNTPPALAGTEWRFTAIDSAPPVGEATLAFEATRLSANAGCNRMAGAWRSESGQLIAGPLMATKMFCEGKMDQERAVGDLLAASPQLTVSGNRMTLASPAHSAELQRTR